MEGVSGSLFRENRNERLVLIFGEWFCLGFLAYYILSVFLTR